MADAVLTIADKVYSSWSLRGYLACRLAGIAFRENLIPFAAADFKARVLAVSAAGRTRNRSRGLPASGRTRRTSWLGLNRRPNF